MVVETDVGLQIENISDIVVETDVGLQIDDIKQKKRNNGKLLFQLYICVLQIGISVHDGVNISHSSGVRCIAYLVFAVNLQPAFYQQPTTCLEFFTNS